ncbi:MAG: MFS transporter [Candidatus Abyssubacteria bacterium]
MNFRANIWKVYLFNFLFHLHFIDGVLVPFFTDWGGISFARVMVLQSWYMLWVFLLEIPTGTVADRWGRKQSLALAALINGGAALVYASTRNFAVFMVGEFMWAASTALFSGACDAFIYDTLRVTGQEARSKRHFGRAESFKMAGIMMAAPVGSFIAARYGLRAPMLLIAAPLAAAFLVGTTFKEPEAHHDASPRDYLSLLRTGTRFFFESRILRVLALDMIVVGSVAYFMIWLYQPMLKQAGVALKYFGVVAAAIAATEIVVMNNFELLERMVGSKRRLVFLSAAITGAMFIVGGLTHLIPLVLMVILIGGGLGLSRRPLFHSYMNKYIPSPQRATVLSTVSMLEKLTVAGVGPFVGLMVDWSLDYTLMLLGAIALGFSFISRVEEAHLIE